MREGTPSRTAYRVAMRRAAHQILDITFDYMRPPHRLPWMRRIGFHLLARRLAAAGEPWTTWFESDTLDRQVRAMGFSELENLDGSALDRRYCGGREKRLGGVSAGCVMTAWNAASAPK